MKNLVGMMRVKNEARWIRRVITSALEVCDWIFVMDDHSSDDTYSICHSFAGRVLAVHSIFQDLDEARDKTWILNQLRATAAEWVLAIDGDELLADHQILTDAVANPFSDCYSLRIVYLWDRDDQARTDGVYGRFWRPSLFKLSAAGNFEATDAGGNFHCGNVPRHLQRLSRRLNSRLLHFGYMHAEDRRRKYEWYNLQDPNNDREDRYRHIIQGDPGGPEAGASLMHAGPLALGAA